MVVISRAVVVAMIVSMVIVTVVVMMVMVEPFSARFVLVASDR
ncbi:hypothetical protein SAMCFNEI73_pB0386 (plasmid) [Sinorhizobium americanum]|uniref:Uncharacterized protein n=1 Tax=Sinorhizobium americanum TaxID=194963 RepID=A0A1L3LU31_9HYPH|nr:hypothetical protein SAMCFNEI73_pB0386 [Sinorhizobium americanum]